MIVERMLILVTAIGLCLVMVALWRLYQQRRLADLAGQSAPEPVAALVKSGPALLYFTTPDCAQCRYQQAPILQQFTSAIGLPVHTVNALEQTDLARHYGIMTVPTTIMLDQQRRPVAINHGLAPLNKLREQAALVA
jgi:thioredoxin-like negative regulator of GroEL